MNLPLWLMNRKSDDSAVRFIVLEIFGAGGDSCGGINNMVAVCCEL